MRGSDQRRRRAGGKRAGVTKGQRDLPGTVGTERGDLERKPERGRNRIRHRERGRAGSGAGGWRGGGAAVLSVSQEGFESYSG